MARAARRTHMAQYDSDSDDEPVGGHYRANRAQRGNAAAAAAASAASAAPAPPAPVPASAASSSTRPDKPGRRLLEPTPPPSPPRGAKGGAGGGGGGGASRRIAAPPSPDSLYDEDDEGGGGNARSNGHGNGGDGGGDDGGPGWGWVTAKLFVQDERILERWGELVDSDLIPSPRDADLEDVRAFKALCAKNPKWIRGGIAFEQRTDVWELLSGSRVYGGRLENPINYYKSLVKQSANIPSKQKKDIRADITRTMQEHPKFKSKAAQAELDRILSAYCVRNPTVGYCQSMSHVVGFLMLLYNEESSFWFLCTLIDQYLPSEFYAPSLLGVRVETEVFARLVADKQGKLARHLAKHEIDLRVVALKWFMCLFLLTLPLEIAARVWDVFLLEGSYVLFNFALALLDMHKSTLLNLHETSLILESLQRIGCDLSGTDDADLLVKKAFSTYGIKEKEIVRLRALARPQLEKEYVAQLQTMESRRENEERVRRRAEAARIKQERAEADALEVGTEVTKVPHNAFGVAAWFSKNSRPKRVQLRLFHTKVPGTNDDGAGAGTPAASASASSAPAADAGGRHGGGDESKHSGGGGGGAGASGSSGGGGGSPLPSDDWRLVWEGSQSKSEAQRTIHLNECQLVIGCTHGVFAARPAVHAQYGGADRDNLCASFLVPANAAIGRDSTSLDVVFDHADQVEQWIKVLRRTNILKIKITAVNGLPDPKKKPKPGGSANGSLLGPPAPAAAGASVSASAPPTATPATTAAATGAAASASASATPAPPAAASSFDDDDETGGGGRRSRRTKSRKGGGVGSLASWEEVDDDPDPSGPQPRRKVMSKPKDLDEADQYDVRDF